MALLLIVDDDEQNRYMLQVLLKGHGYDVITAENGAEALEIARRTPPTLVISDILMPAMDGFTLCRHWMKDEQLRTIPFVFYTATYTDPRDEEFAMSLGAARFIVKPVEPAHFLAALREVIQSHEAGRLEIPTPPPQTEEEKFRAYNETLIRKLESKMVALEETRRELEQRAEQIAQQRDHLALLHRIEQSIASTLSLDSILDLLAGELRRALHFNRLSIWLLDESGDAMTGRGYGLRPEDPDIRRFRLPRDAPLVAPLFETQQPRFIPDAGAPEYAELFTPDIVAAFGIQAVLLVPLLLRDEVIGLMMLDDTNIPCFFTPEEVELVQSVAAQAAIAIDNARLFESVQRSERRYRTLFEGMPVGLYRTAADGTILDINPAAVEMLAYPNREALLAVNAADLYADPDDRRRWQAQMEEHGFVRDFVSRMRRFDGEMIWVQETARLVKDPRHRQIRYEGSLQDITDRVEAEAELRRRNRELALLQQVIEQATEAILITDTDAVIEFVNPAYERITGYRREEVIGRNPSIVKSGEHDDLFYETLWSAIRNGLVWKGNIINRRKDGHLFTVETIIIPILDEGGTITHYAGIQRDVTRELLLEEQNRQAQKMEAVGQLTAGIAHDFNNILTAINGYAELLQMHLANDQTAQRMLGQILISGKRAADLVSQLLAFGRKAIIRPKILDLSLVIADLDKMLRRVIGEDIEIKTQFQPHLWAVKMDPSQVEQVVVNLAVNARDAMPRGGTLTIELKNVTLDKTYADEHIEVEPGDYVLLAVTDTGTGMPPEVMEHIFEPFFTTKEVGKGSGLGLSTVFGIVKQNDGHIRVYSEEGKGTTFKIYLPAVGVAPPPAPKEEKRTEVRGGTETILLVEDEPQVRKLAFNTLTAQGYTVLDAPDGEAALKTAQTYTGPIHLLLTDVIMPRMGGKELAKRLKALRPDVRVLYTSGYTSNAIVHHGVLEPGLAFLEKPFSARALLRKVRQVLDAQEEG